MSENKRSDLHLVTCRDPGEPIPSDPNYLVVLEESMQQEWRNRQKALPPGSRDYSMPENPLLDEYLEAAAKAGKTLLIVYPRSSMNDRETSTEQ